MRRVLLQLCALSLLGVSASAQNWVEIKSKNFTVLTDGGDKRGREVALRFEQMRKVFGTLLLRDKIAPTGPLTILAFKNRKELSTVAPLWKGKPVDLAGVYYGGSGADDQHFIAIDLSSAGGWAVVFHEYAHMLLNTNYPPAQPWFDEGFAEYFSTINMGKDKVKIGIPPDYIGQQLAGSLEPVEKLFSVTHASKDYNEGDRRSKFYAESWLVVHYLYDAKTINKVGKYFDLALNQGEPVAQAIKEAFGVEPKQFDRELNEYVRGNRATVMTIEMPDVPEDVTYATRKMKDYEASAVVADLHLHSRDYFDKAQGELEAVLKQDSENVEALRGLGYWYMRKGDLDKAGEYFQHAAKLGSTDARVHYMVAQALYSKGDRDPQTMSDMMQSLQLATKYDPNFAEAYNLQGYVLASMQDYPNAIEAIKKAIKINPRNEHFKLNLAQEYMAAAKYDDAIEMFEKLKDSADESIAQSATRQMAMAHEYKDKPLMRLSERSQPTNDDKEVATSTDSEELKAMEARQRGEEIEKPDTRPMKYVTGKLLSVDCGKEPSAILRVVGGQKTYSFTAASAKKVVVIGANEFSCLWKDRKVSVNYHESGPLRGDVVSVEVY
jgi:tetratricopeptide (TPR) repeat protein